MPPRHELAPPQDPTHMLPEGHRSSPIGPWIGTIIIVVLLAFGALYFYGEYLNNKNATQEVPLIQGDISI